MIDKILWIIFCLTSTSFCIWAFKHHLKQIKRWRIHELKQYLDDCYKTPCKSCDGSGYEGYTFDGDPTGEICEDCESHGFVWRAICPPRWLKHNPIWRQSEFEQLQMQALK